jgi:YggT family protein
MGTLGYLISLILTVFQFVLLARVLMSWFPDIANSSNPTVQQVVRLIYDITEPVLRPIRNALPQTGMMDFSPLIVFLIIAVLQRVF